MITSVVSTREYYITIDVFSADGDSIAVYSANELTFMQAGDYAESSVNFFKVALIQNPDWFSVQIEINDGARLVEVIEIKR